MKLQFGLLLIMIITGFHYTNGQEIEVEYIILDSIDNKEKDFSLKFNSIKEAEEFKTNKIEDFVQKGYLNLELEKASHNSTQTTYHLRLNTKTDSIKISISTKDKAILNHPQKNSEFIEIKFEEWEDTQKQIINSLKLNGYDFAKVKYSPLKIEGNILYAKLVLEVNQLKKFNDLYIRGYDEFPEGFKKNFIRIKKGEVYTERKLKQKTKAIQNIDFVTEIKNPEVQFTKDSVNVFLYLEKNKINSFDGFIGFNNDDEGSGLNLNGYLDAVLKNNLNFGETLIIRYKNDGQEQQIFKSRLSLPFIFNTRLTPELGIELFRQDSTFARSTQEIRLGYHINYQWEVFGDIEFNNSSNLLTEGNSSNELYPINDFNAQFYGVTTRFNNRKRNIGKIINQDFAEVRILQGNRKTSNESEQQTKIEFYGETLQKITTKTYIHLASTIQALDSKKYVDNELFRLGGLRSMRGFDENSIIASSFYSLQTEFRYFLSSELYANTVLDYGYYQNKLVRIDENLLSFGFGIGLNTKGGLLRLIFANGRSSQQEFNFQNTQVHLSLNTFF